MKWVQLALIMCIKLLSLQVLFAMGAERNCECAGKSSLNQNGCQLSPTVYYKPHIVINPTACVLKNLVNMRIQISEKEFHTIQICPKDHRLCTMQGSCSIEYLDKRMTISYRGNSQKSRTTHWEKTKCEFGSSSSGSCIDPFFSVAADTNFNKYGDLIFIEALVGKELPDGRIHDGYLQVVDKGDRIIGMNRFDLNTGSLTDKDPENLFTNGKLGIDLGNSQKKVRYCKITNKTRVQKILESRKQNQNSQIAKMHSQ